MALESISTNVFTRLQAAGKTRDPGFHRRSFHLVCSETGAWSGPGCSPVSCPALPPVYTGLYACTDAWYAGSVCAFACPGAASVRPHRNGLHVYLSLITRVL